MAGRQVSVEKEFDNVAKQLSECNARIMDSFKLYIQVVSAIIGGSIYLSLQQHDKLKNAQYAALSDCLVALVTLVAIVMIYENLREWHGYRKAQSRLSGVDDNGAPYIPGPRGFQASRVESALMLAMVATALLFWWFNPFLL
jgi:hypothetical protein